MKKLYLFFLFLFLVLFGQSQDTWGPPFPLTDSLTDNVNATLSILPADFLQPDTLYMLWERSSDMSSTSIYARNLTTMAGPFMVVAQQNIHFKHPRVFRRGAGDTLFYFSYETDMNGNWDLYYSVLMKNEVALGPFPFIRTSMNERSLNWGNTQTFSWEKEGSIYVKNVTGDTVFLASDSCSNPVQSGEGFVGYEMNTGPELGVFYSEYNQVTHLWSGPFPLDVYGSNSHLTMGNDSYGNIMAPYAFWQHKNGPYWIIKGFDLFDIYYVSINNFQGSNNISPSFCTVNIITDHHYFPNVDFFTFASDVSGNMEIYVNNWIYDTSYSNISYNSSNDTHPQLFNNFYFSSGGLDNQLFDIWESYRGGHWQLWATTMDILTGEKNLTNPVARMKCSPNPFSECTRIEYFNREEGEKCFTIYDLNGKKIAILNGATTIGNGKYSVTWNGIDDSGNPVPAGIYICAVTAGKTVSHCKIIRR